MWKANEAANKSELINMANHEDGQPHSSSTRACDPTDFNLFVQSRIRELGTLCANMGHANFVAMDIEHGAGVSSIGLAFAPKLGPVRYLNHPEVLTGNREGAPWYTATVRSMCFNIRGFERYKPTEERVWGQPDEDIDIQDVASKVMDTVRMFKETEPERPLILVTYSSSAELSAISALVPQLHRLFSSWVDLQPIVRDVYHSRTNYTRLDGLLPSLRCAMRSLGFRAGFQPAHLHHAGNDALRTIAIMACLTHENVQFRRIKKLERILKWRKHQNEQHPLKGTEESRSLPSNKPEPPSQHSHASKVTVVPAPNIKPEVQAGHSAAGLAEEQECKVPQVWDISPYEPSAIGRVCRENSYYGCLPSSETLQHLIEELVKR
jgi:hypothetical protein